MTWLWLIIKVLLLVTGASVLAFWMASIGHGMDTLEFWLITIIMWFMSFLVMTHHLSGKEY